MTIANRASASYSSAYIAHSAFRVGYVDILRVLAAVIVLNNTFAKATFDERTNSMPLDTPQGIFRDASWAITLLFMISGRVVTAVALPPSSSAENFKPNYPALVSSMFRRAFRFALPVIIVAFTQWQLCKKGHTAKASASAQEIFLGSTTMAPAPAGWCSIGGFSGLITFIVDLFTFNGPAAAEKMGSMLWTVTWFMEGSYAVYLTAFLTAQLASNRYVVFATLMAFSWVTYSWNWVFLLGYVICDMKAHGHFHRPRNSFVAIALQILSLVLAFGIKWVLPLRDFLNNTFAHLQIDIASNNLVHFADTLSVFFLLTFFELAPTVQSILSFRIFKHIGHLAAGIYLLHPLYLYTVIPQIAGHLRSSNFSRIVGICWLALVVLSTVTAFFFYQLIEKQSVAAGIYAWRWLAHPAGIIDGYIPGDKVKPDKYKVITETDNGRGKRPEMDVMTVGPATTA
ncbi:uncharacterized protein EV422DRAFT_494507 [Fimicolochytrium jonesii]|uniref:uncharacterized protein n=1 Tax=Fimicolochytrium jonesii TaxID=1396493 RepID=UPI0022FE6AAD|nr:uncharacterized protein EV422DRAFT_494507 [Fimicolochytrium jonesii]KAI8822985.1 hypothetical protein EV422DRAFT_494507 [Fimicolochytrium jonesii]